METNGNGRLESKVGRQIQNSTACFGKWSVVMLCTSGDKTPKKTHKHWCGPLRAVYPVEVLLIAH